MKTINRDNLDEIALLTEGALSKKSASREGRLAEGKHDLTENLKRNGYASGKVQPRVVNI